MFYFSFYESVDHPPLPSICVRILVKVLRAHQFLNFDEEIASAVITSRSSQTYDRFLEKRKSLYEEIFFETQKEDNLLTYFNSGAQTELKGLLQPLLELCLHRSEFQFRQPGRLLARFLWNSPRFHQKFLHSYRWNTMQPESYDYQMDLHRVQLVDVYGFRSLQSLSYLATNYIRSPSNPKKFCELAVEFSHLESLTFPHASTDREFHEFFRSVMDRYAEEGKLYIISWAASHLWALHMSLKFAGWYPGYYSSVWHYFSILRCWLPGIPDGAFVPGRFSERVSGARSNRSGENQAAERFRRIVNLLIL